MLCHVSLPRAGRTQGRRKRNVYQNARLLKGPAGASGGGGSESAGQARSSPTHVLKAGLIKGVGASLGAADGDSRQRDLWESRGHNTILSVRIVPSGPD